MKDISIRKATNEDLESIINLYMQLWQTEQIFDSNLKDLYYSTKKSRKEFIKDIKNNYFLLAIYENKIVGYLDGYYIKNKDAFKEKMAYLDELSVENNYKKLGIGSKLIDAFTELCKKDKVKYIKLCAFENNIPAVSLYKKLGFEEYSVVYRKRID